MLRSILLFSAVFSLVAQVWGSPPEPQSDDDRKTVYPYPLNHVVHIEPEDLGECFALVATHDFPSSYRMDRSAQKCIPHLYRDKSSWKHPLSKLDSFNQYLQGDTARACDYATGNESQLEKWIVAQPDNSINHLTLFREALRIEKGNIYSAVLMIHQLLRNEARWGQYPRYQFISNPIRQKRFFAKFIDARGDLSERGKGFVGDHAGSWYRIWAGMLLRMQFMDDSHFNGLYGPRPMACMRRAPGLFEQLSENLQGHLAILIDTRQSAVWDALSSNAAAADGYYNSKIVKREPDSRKQQLDRNGSDSAAAAFNSLRHENDSDLSSTALSLNKCLAGGYLKIGTDP